MLDESKQRKIITCLVCGKKIAGWYTRKYCGDKDKEGTCSNKAKVISGRWKNMMARCYDPKHDAYAYYGGRGIRVCDQWHDKKTFLLDVKDGFDYGLSLDRINNEKNYSPENVRWASITEQAQNKRSNIFVTLNNKTRCLSDWCRNLNISADLVFSRKQIGWSNEEALGIKERVFIKPQTMRERESISDKHYLGSLCKKNHDYEDTGKSKRFKIGKTCCLCARDYLREKRNK